MVKFDLEAYDINKNYAIEASAGTGKTYNIVEIVNKLVNNNIDFSKIVIVTYTEKAAGELKDRIRKKINNVDINSGFIGTIHSFTQQLINEFGLSGNFAIGLTMQQDKHIDDFINRYIRREDVISKILAYDTFDVDGFGKYLKNIIKNYYLDKDGKEVKSIVSIDKELLYSKRKSAIKKFDEKQLAYELADECYLAWKKEKQTKRIQSFDDMILNVREALYNNEKFAHEVRNKYQYAIIDEFQDTNQKQFDIFEKIFMQDNLHHIIVVGDPKQSIYSFQQADIEVYFKAVEKIVSNNGEKYLLTKNYRSTEKMVEACNMLFPNFELEKDNITFLPSEYKEENKDENISRCYYQKKQTPAFWITEDKVNSQQFAHIAAEIIVDICCCENGKTKLQLEDGGKIRNVRFSDIAILAKSKSEMKPIQNALQKCGIPFIRYKDDSLFSSMENAHWISMLQAINVSDFTGNNRKYLKKVLTTKFFGYSLKDITSDYFDRDDIKEIEILNDFKKAAQEQRWQDLIDDILFKTKLKSNVGSLNDIQPYAIFKQIGDYCIDYLSKGHNLLELITELKQNISKDDDEATAIIEKSTDFNSVRIMTIHASKGLEFPIVISVAGFKGNRKSKEIYSYRKVLDSESLPMISLEKDSDLVNLKDSQEQKRLFYVAYTRAKYLLILPQYKDFKADFLSNSFKAFTSKFSDYYRYITDNGKTTEQLKREVGLILKPFDIRNNQDKMIEQRDNIKKVIDNIKANRAMMFSYSSLSHPAIIDDDLNNLSNSNGIVVENEHEIEGLSKYDRNAVVANIKYDTDCQPIVFPENFPKGAAVGTAMHEIFELLDYTDYQSSLNKIIKRCFVANQIVYDDNWTESLKQMVDNVLTSDITIFHGGVDSGQTFKLNSISNDNKRAECEFNVNMEDSFLKNYFNGFIDLLVKIDDRVVIIDWKSDSLNQQFTSYADAQQLINHVNDSYSIQRTLYGYYLIEALSSKYPNKTKQQVFNDHFGGVCYVFLRGCNENKSNGIYCQSWSSYEQLKQSFDEIVNDRIKK